MTVADVTAWLVWILPLFSSLFVPIVARVSSKARNFFVVVIAAVTAILGFTLVPAITASPNGVINLFVSWIPSSSVNVGVFLDPLSVLFACLVGFFGLIIAIYSLGYMKHEENLTRYYFFLLLFIGSMIGLVISDNFLQMFIFWEMVGFCSYSLISFWNNRPESVKSGNKVFLMTRIGDISLLAAIGILYASLGSFSFRYTIDHISALPTSTVALVAFLTLGGAIAKSAQLPLHTWLYSAMEAPTSVSALLHAATMVKAGIYLIARFVLIAGPLVVSLPFWLPAVAWIGVLTAFLGATMALFTPDIKGVLAYSTVSQLGFMMAALGSVSAAAASSLGWFASLFHMMSHAFFEGLGFLLAGGIIHALGTRDMRLMGGLKNLMPVTFWLSMVMAVTTSGIPPFAAFFSKGLIITSITEAGNLLQIVLIYATTAITFAYSMRFITLIFMRKKSEYLQELHPHEAPSIMLVPAGVLAVFCFIWGFIQPTLGSFMGNETEVSLLGSFLNSETLVFALILVPAGLLVYATYFRNFSLMGTFMSESNPLVKLLKHGYFFDDFYEGVAAKSMMYLSSGIRNVEVVVFEAIPQAVAGGVIRIAGGVHRYLDTAADQLLVVIAGETIEGASKVKTFDRFIDRMLDVLARRTTSPVSRKSASSESLQHYLAAALLGFIILVILIIVSIGV